MPLVKVFWFPYFAIPTRYRASTQTIFLNGENDPLEYQPDEYDDDVLLHEYGHHLETSLGFGHVFSDTASTAHTFTTEATVNGVPSAELAWLEGWAHYFAGEVNGTGVIRNRGRFENGAIVLQEVNLEPCTVIDVWAGNAQANDQGMTWELPVAGLVWDVVDATNDNENSPICGDVISDGNARSWQAVRDGLSYYLTVCGYTYDVLWQVGNYSPAKRAAIEEVRCEHGVGCSSNGQFYATSTCLECSLDPPITGAERLELAGTGAVARFVPNPTRGSAVLMFESSGPGLPQRIRIHDLAGRVVRRLAWTSTADALQTVVWDSRSDSGKPVPPGLYYVLIEEGACRQIVRVAVLR